MKEAFRPMQYLMIHAYSAVGEWGERRTGDADEIGNLWTLQFSGFHRTLSDPLTGKRAASFAVVGTLSHILEISVLKEPWRSLLQ
jgi:hypothetical protein